MSETTRTKRSRIKKAALWAVAGGAFGFLVSLAYTQFGST